MDQASIESELSPSPTQASKAEVRRAKARENSRRTRQKKKLEMIYTATRIQTALSDTRLLNESRQQCASIHQFQAFLIDEHLLEMLLQRRAQLDARNAQVKLQFQDAIAHINRYRCNFLLPPPRFSLNLLHPVPLLPPLAVDIGTCQELANFSASPYVRTYFVPFRGWDIQIWNSGDCTVNVKSNLSVNWNPEMAMNTTWEILKSPNRSHQILLDIPTHGVMQVGFMDLLFPLSILLLGYDIYWVHRFSN